MKRLLNASIHVKDEHLMTGFFIFIVLCLVVYLVLIYYTFFVFINRDDIHTSDFVVYGFGSAAHKCLMRKRRKIFGKN